MYYFIGYLETQNILKLKPKVISWANDRIIAIESSYFWLQEMKYLNEDESYFDILN